jgi:alpha-glucosidase
MKKSGNCIIFETDGSHKLCVTPIADSTLQIWADYEGNGVKEETFSTCSINLPYSDFSVAEKDEYFLVKTKVIALRVYKSGIHIEYYKADNETLITSEISMGWDDNSKVFLYHSLSKSEHFYGLGEDNDAYLGNLDRRGTTRDMITGQRINTGHVTADIPITFFMSTGDNMPYGIFTDNSYRMFYDMGKESDEYYFQQADGGNLLFYFFAADSFSDILNEYTNITGKPSMPPLWTLGYMQSKCSYYSWDEIDEIIENMRNYNIPLDCIVFDYDWAEYFQNFKWHSRWNGNSLRRIAELKEQGLHFMVSNSGPMIKKESDNFQSGLDAGIFVKGENDNTVTCGHYGGELMDFSNPKMKEWLSPQLNKILDDGIDGWWLDLTEPEGDPNGTQYYAGDKSKVHNSFSLMNTKTYNEISLEYNKNKRPFILTRTGTAGIQKYTTAIWSGDVFSDYKTFAAHIPEALNTSMSGIPLWTSDSGGFMSSTNNAVENMNLYNNDITSHALLYERWLQFACFSPITRAHHAGQSAPYVFNELLTNSIGHYIRLRYKLIPYIYSYNYESYKTGSPIMQPLVYEYPDDKNVYNLKDEYLFGNEILVAPVLEEKATERTVYFPKGKWYDWDYGYEYEGNTENKIYAPQSRIPLFVRAGAIIPMAPQTFITKQIDWQNIVIHVYPHEKSKFNLFTDDGESYDFVDGDYTLTSILCDENMGEKTTITISRSNFKFSATSYTLIIHVNSIPQCVCHNNLKLDILKFKSLFDNADSGYFYDDFQNLLYVKINSLNGLRHDVSVEYLANSQLRHKKGYDDGIKYQGQLPFLLPPSSLPCRINCENFDRGGENVAYHKQTQGNLNQIYRKDGVDIETCDDIGAGYNFAKLKADEWLEYTVLVRTAGDYCFNLRLKATEKSKIRIDVNGQNTSGLYEFYEKSWSCLTISGIHLSEGEQVVRLLVHKGEICGNWIEISYEK